MTDQQVIYRQNDAHIQRLHRTFTYKIFNNRLVIRLEINFQAQAMTSSNKTIDKQSEKVDIQNLEMEELQELLEVNPAKWIGISLFIAGFLVITPLLNAVPEFFS